MRASFGTKKCGRHQRLDRKFGLRRSKIKLTKIVSAKAVMRKESLFENTNNSQNDASSANESDKIPLKENIPSHTEDNTLIKESNPVLNAGIVPMKEDSTSINKNNAPRFEGSVSPAANVALNVGNTAFKDSDEPRSMMSGLFDYFTNALKNEMESFLGTNSSGTSLAEPLESKRGIEERKDIEDARLPNNGIPGMNNLFTGGAKHPYQSEGLREEFAFTNQVKSEVINENSFPEERVEAKIGKITLSDCDIGEISEIVTKMDATPALSQLSDYYKSKNKKATFRTLQARRNVPDRNPYLSSNTTKRNMKSFKQYILSSPATHLLPSSLDTDTGIGSENVASTIENTPPCEKPDSIIEQNDPNHSEIRKSIWDIALENRKESEITDSRFDNQDQHASESKANTEGDEFYLDTIPIILSKQKRSSSTPSFFPQDMEKTLAEQRSDVSSPKGKGVRLPNTPKLLSNQVVMNSLSDYYNNKHKKQIAQNCQFRGKLNPSDNNQQALPKNETVNAMSFKHYLFSWAAHLTLSKDLGKETEPEKAIEDQGNVPSLEQPTKHISKQRSSYLSAKKTMPNMMSFKQYLLTRANTKNTNYVYKARQSEQLDSLSKQGNTSLDKHIDALKKSSYLDVAPINLNEPKRSSSFETMLGKEKQAKGQNSPKTVISTPSNSDSVDSPTSLKTKATRSVSYSQKSLSDVGFSISKDKKERTDTRHTQFRRKSNLKKRNPYVSPKKTALNMMSFKQYLLSAAKEIALADKETRVQKASSMDAKQSGTGESQGNESVKKDVTDNDDNALKESFYFDMIPIILNDSKTGGSSLGPSFPDRDERGRNDTYENSHQLPQQNEEASLQDISNDLKVTTDFCNTFEDNDVLSRIRYKQSGPNTVKPYSNSATCSKEPRPSNCHTFKQSNNNDSVSQIFDALISKHLHERSQNKKPRPFNQPIKHQKLCSDERKRLNKKPTPIAKVKGSNFLQSTTVNKMVEMLENTQDATPAELLRSQSKTENLSCGKVGGLPKSVPKVTHLKGVSTKKRTDTKLSKVSKPTQRVNSNYLKYLASRISRPAMSQPSKASAESSQDIKTHPVSDTQLHALDGVSETTILNAFSSFYKGKELEQIHKVVKQRGKKDGKVIQTLNKSSWLASKKRVKNSKPKQVISNYMEYLSGVSVPQLQGDKELNEHYEDSNKSMQSFPKDKLGGGLQVDDTLDTFPNSSDILFHMFDMGSKKNDSINLKDSFMGKKRPLEEGLKISDKEIKKQVGISNALFTARQCGLNTRNKPRKILRKNSNTNFHESKNLSFLNTIIKKGTPLPPTILSYGKDIQIDDWSCGFLDMEENNTSVNLESSESCNVSEEVGMVPSFSENDVDHEPRLLGGWYKPRSKQKGGERSSKKNSHPSMRKPSKNDKGTFFNYLQAVKITKKSNATKTYPNHSKSKKWVPLNFNKDPNQAKQTKGLDRMGKGNVNSRLLKDSKSIANDMNKKALARHDRKQESVLKVNGKSFVIQGNLKNANQRNAPENKEKGRREESIHRLSIKPINTLHPPSLQTESLKTSPNLANTEQQTNGATSAQERGKQKETAATKTRLSGHEHVKKVVDSKSNAISLEHVYNYLVDWKKKNDEYSFPRLQHVDINTKVAEDMLLAMNKESEMNRRTPSPSPPIVPSSSVGQNETRQLPPQVTTHQKQPMMWMSSPSKSLETIQTPGVQSSLSNKGSTTTAAAIAEAVAATSAKLAATNITSSSKVESANTTPSIQVDPMNTTSSTNVDAVNTTSSTMKNVSAEIRSNLFTPFDYKRTTTKLELRESAHDTLSLLNQRKTSVTGLLTNTDASINDDQQLRDCSSSTDPVSLTAPTSNSHLKSAYRNPPSQRILSIMELSKSHTNSTSDSHLGGHTLIAQPLNQDLSSNVDSLQPVNDIRKTKSPVYQFQEMKMMYGSPFEITPSQSEPASKWQKDDDLSQGENVSTAVSGAKLQVSGSPSLGRQRSFLSTITEEQTLSTQATNFSYSLNESSTDMPSDSIAAMTSRKEQHSPSLPLATYAEPSHVSRLQQKHEIASTSLFARHQRISPNEQEFDTTNECNEQFCLPNTHDKTVTSLPSNEKPQSTSVSSSVSIVSSMSSPTAIKKKPSFLSMLLNYQTDEKPDRSSYNIVSNESEVDSHPYLSSGDAVIAGKLSKDNNLIQNKTFDEVNRYSFMETRGVKEMYETTQTSTRMSNTQHDTNLDIYRYNLSHENKTFPAFETTTDFLASRIPTTITENRWGKLGEYEALRATPSRVSSSYQTPMSRTQNRYQSVEQVNAKHDFDYRKYLTQRHSDPIFMDSIRSKPKEVGIQNKLYKKESSSSNQAALRPWVKAFQTRGNTKSEKSFNKLALRNISSNRKKEVETQANEYLQNTTGNNPSPSKLPVPSPKSKRPAGYGTSLYSCQRLTHAAFRLEDEFMDKIESATKFDDADNFKSISLNEY